METLFRRYFWAVNLAVLAAVAWIVAKTAVDHLASQYLVASSEPLDAPDAEANPGIARAPGVAGRLSTRRPFNVEPAVAPAAPEAAPAPDPIEAPPDAAPPTVERSQLDIQLQGTFAGPVEPTVRFASIAAEGSPQLVQVGSDVLGKAEVVDVAPKMLYLREGDRLTYVSLWPDGQVPVPRAPVPPAAPAARLDRPPRVQSDSPAASASKQFIRRVSDTEYELDRAWLHEQLSDPTEVTRGARIQPHFTGGRYDGFTLLGVPPTGVFGALGLRSGDVLHAFNGTAISSPNKALELLPLLQSARKVVMEVARGGQRITVTVHIP